MSEADYAHLVTAAHRHLRAPVIFVLGQSQHSYQYRDARLIEAHPDWLTEVRLPAYAPDLNAVEGAWANMKNGLGNLAAADVDQLTAIIKNRSKASSTSLHSSMLPRPDWAQPRTRTAVDLPLSTSVSLTERVPYCGDA